ncbi:hypothetical protein RJ55_07235 [Drechmeria coniospora]|nr:hypothetical protein RJ55_07235 [Drechmeria coniospora]
MFSEVILVLEIIGYTVAFLVKEARYALRATVVRQQARWFGATAATERKRNIVIVGASFAGYHVARIIGRSLPPGSEYQCVVVEPSSHFRFTWVLPRFCVVKGHEQKAFIPYGGYIRGAPEGVVRWITGRVARVTAGSVKLDGDEGAELPYDFLVIATGSYVRQGLPSRVNDDDRNAGMSRMRAMQDAIESANSVVVVGGGAAGVEMATDVADLYPTKRVTLVHSKEAVMHRFGNPLREAAQEALDKLGVHVILDDRVVKEDAGVVTLRSGRTIGCDYLVSLLVRSKDAI